MKPEDSDDYSETNESIKDAGFIQNVRSNSSPFINSPHLTGSLTSLDLASHRRIIKVVTVFSIIFFIVCFVMIITTLKYSQYVDEKIRQSYRMSQIDGTNMTETLQAYGNIFVV